MSKRREFDRKTRAQIVLRATKDDGNTYCERPNCGVLCKPGQYEINHKDMDAMQLDKSKRLTAEEGELICKPCHKGTTKEQMAVLAKNNRIQQSRLGVKKRPSVPLQSAGFAPVDKSTKRTANRPVEKFGSLPLPRLARLAAKG